MFSLTSSCTYPTSLIPLYLLYLILSQPHPAAPAPPTPSTFLKPPPPFSSLYPIDFFHPFTSQLKHHLLERLFPRPLQFSTCLLAVPFKEVVTGCINCCWHLYFLLKCSTHGVLGSCQCFFHRVSSWMLPRRARDVTGPWLHVHSSLSWLLAACPEGQGSKQDWHHINSLVQQDDYLLGVQTCIRRHKACYSWMWVSGWRTAQRHSKQVEE